MTMNLLRESWAAVDAAELLLLLVDRLGGPGQFRGLSKEPLRFYLPLADSSCWIVLVYRNKKIVAIEPGPAFDEDQWNRISGEIDKSLLDGPMKVGREYSFNSHRVLGSWRGERSGVQILPPPDDAPRAPVEIAKHPFILEFPIRESDFQPVTNHRRLRDHRKLTLLLNVLLDGRTSFEPRRSEHFWALLQGEDDGHQIEWVQRFYFAKLGKRLIDELSPPAGSRIGEVDPDEYYAWVGDDGKGLRVSTDLDQSIVRYRLLSSANRARFDRAAFWLDVAAQQWTISVSASFTALVSAIESLTECGTKHAYTCPICEKPREHEVPGATRRFNDFLDTYAPGATLKKRRDKMYGVRSDVLHGSDLLMLDQDPAFGVDPTEWNEILLQDELWGLTRVALRNWLSDPPTRCSWQRS